jgi:hypothetical protein
VGTCVQVLVYKKRGKKASRDPADATKAVGHLDEVSELRSNAATQHGRCSAAAEPAHLLLMPRAWLAAMGRNRIGSTVICCAWLGCWLQLVPC